MWSGRGEMKERDNENEWGKGWLISKRGERKTGKRERRGGTIHSKGEKWWNDVSGGLRGDLCWEAVSK